MPKLKPFQVQGRDFLAARSRALLADQMRLGKTVQAITAARKAGCTRIVIICPAVAVTHWQHEIATWWGSAHLPRVLVQSYEWATANANAFKSRFDLLILDESHYLKNPAAKRTQAVFGTSGLVRWADRVWAMSGTPAPNGLHELWPLLYTFGSTKLHYEQFIQYFCYVRDGKVLGRRNDRLAELRGMIKDVTLRRLTKDVAPELPKTRVVPYYVKADSSMLDLAWPVRPEAQLSRMQRVEQDLKASLRDVHHSEVAEYLLDHVDELTTLRRVTSMLKVPALIDTLTAELETVGGKYVVFGFFREPMQVAANMLKEKYRVDVIWGGTSRRKRDSTLVRFNRVNKGTDVLFVNIIAGGVAIDLSAAHEGFLLERDWVPANNAQALERMGGYKQTHPVTIRDVLIPGSIDAILARVLQKKTSELSNLYED